MPRSRRQRNCVHRKRTRRNKTTSRKWGVFIMNTIQIINQVDKLCDAIREGGGGGGGGSFPKLFNTIEFVPNYIASFDIKTEGACNLTMGDNVINMTWTGSSAIGIITRYIKAVDLTDLDKITLTANVTAHYSTNFGRRAKIKANDLTISSNASNGLFGCGHICRVGALADAHCCDNDSALRRRGRRRNEIRHEPRNRLNHPVMDSGFLLLL